MIKSLKKVMLCLTFVISCLFISDVYAASAKISLSRDKGTVIVGEKVKVTINLSSSQALGSWNFNVKYDSNYLSFVSSTLEGSDQAVNSATNDKTKSKTYTITFKAKKSGTTKVSINSGAEVYAFTDESKMTLSTNSVTIKNITRDEYESSLSSDNTLKDLKVEGYELNPAFDKNKTDYSLTVPNDVRKIKVSATKNDSKAEVHGTGTIELKEGLNKVAVEVEAENGNSKTYTINVTVKELDPIDVEVDGIKYNVVRKREDLEAPQTYVESTAVIDGQEVPAYESEITGYTLVGLSDESGKVNLYIYDNDTYILYKEYKFAGITLYIVKPDEIPMDPYEETNVKIGEEEVAAYNTDVSTYPLVYGVNVATGKKDWYTYDEEEGTLQRYLEPTKNEKVVKNDDKYKNLAIILGGISSVLFIIIIVATIKLCLKKKQSVNY